MKQPQVIYTIILEDVDGLGNLGALTTDGQEDNLREIAAFFNRTYTGWRVVEAIGEYPSIVILTKEDLEATNE